MPGPRVRFTREDVELLPEHIRAELIEGDLVMMVPAPTPWHQGLAARLNLALTRHFGSGADDRVLGPPLEVVVWRGHDENILQPDVVVLPEGTRATGRGWKLPRPLWVAEVLSPSTEKRDRGVKLRLYALAGIREAWLVDPETETIDVHDLASGGSRLFRAGDVAESAAIPGFRVDVGRLFAT
jgi:Uma2 family endonuclease